jgi:hypothetical protein
VGTFNEVHSRSRTPSAIIILNALNALYLTNLWPRQVVYLNGVEIYRTNMKPGPVDSHIITALSSISGDAELVQKVFKFNATARRAWTSSASHPVAPPTGGFR